MLNLQKSWWKYAFYFVALLVFINLQSCGNGCCCCRILEKDGEIVDVLENNFSCKYTSCNYHASDKSCEEETDAHCCKRNYLPGFYSYQCGQTGTTEHDPDAFFLRPTDNEVFPSGTQSISIVAKGNDIDKNLKSIIFRTSNGFEHIVQSAQNNTEYSATWNTSSLTDGVYTISVEARDLVGNSDRASIIIHIGGKNINKAPVVSLLSPSDVTEFMTNGETITLKANVSDPDGHTIKEVSFYMDGNKIGDGTLVGSNYECAWTVTGTAGKHVFHAKAKDEKNLEGTSGQVNITLKTKSGSQPTLDGVNTVSIISFTDKSGTSIMGSATSFDPGTNSNANLSMVVNKNDANATLSKVRLNIISDKSNSLQNDKYSSFATGTDKNIIRTITLNAVAGQNNYSFSWDGKDGSSNPGYLIGGNYTAIIEGVLVKQNYEIILTSQTSFKVQFSNQGIESFTSIDKMVHAVVVIPASVTSATVELINTSTGFTQNLGKSDDLLSSVSSSIIHTKLDDIYSDNSGPVWEQIANSASGYPDGDNLIIVKDDAFNQTSNRKFHIYGIFDEIGEAKIVLELGDGSRREAKKMLTTNEDFGGLINYTAGFIGTDLNNIVVTTAFSSGSPLAKTASMYVPIFDPFAYAENYVRGLTTLALARVYYLVEHNLITATALNIAISGTKGFFNGVSDGAKDDFLAIVETVELLKDIKKRAKEFANFIWWAVTDFNDFFTAMTDMFDKAIFEFDSDARESVVWQIPGAPMELGYRAYIGSYAAGYTLEQVAVIAVGAGVVKSLKPVVLVSRSTVLGRGVQYAIGLTNSIQRFKTKTWRFATRSLQQASSASLGSINESLLRIRKMIQKTCEIEVDVSGTKKKIAECLPENYSHWSDKYEALRVACKDQWETQGTQILHRIAIINVNLTKYGYPIVSDATIIKLIEKYGTTWLFEGASLWDVVGWTRGNIFHELFGENLPHTFRHIDKWDLGTKTITSIKSCDLNPKRQTG